MDTALMQTIVDTAKAAVTDKLNEMKLASSMHAEAVLVAVVAQTRAIITLAQAYAEAVERIKQASPMEAASPMRERLAAARAAAAPDVRAAAAERDPAKRRAKEEAAAMAARAKLEEGAAQTLQTALGAIAAEAGPAGELLTATAHEVRQAKDAQQRQQVLDDGCSKLAARMEREERTAAHWQAAAACSAAVAAAALAILYLSGGAECVADTGGVLYEATVLGDVNKLHGTMNEPAALDRAARDAGGEVVRDNRVYYKELSVAPVPVTVLIKGRVDAWRANVRVIVEVKKRQRRLFPKIPKYELVQLQCYMWLTDTEQCQHTQDFRGKRRTEMVQREADWESAVLRPGLQHFVRDVIALSNDLALQQQLLSDPEVGSKLPPPHRRRRVPS
ncbi:hypothetical protein JKP88DRAFT_316471 [Tribonema minus]|uniref:Uncharacterized protein n=1 Tax=Tribonema minus TaxID=303371 RepID=A0A836CFF5_9STRA|nr:hypothetical protein JKP88DRAFT_316471 [Tribonema minus]